MWEFNATRDERLARTQSSGSVWKGILWVVGGHGLDLKLPLTMAFNISGLSYLENNCEKILNKFPA